MINIKNNILKMGNLNILYMNICSIKNKLLELETIVSELEQIDIVIINEVWLFDYEVPGCNLPNFKAVYNCRNDDERKGGTAIFIKNNIPFTEICKEEKYNFTVIEILNAKQKLKIGTFYREPSSNPNSFIEFLENKLRQDSNHIFFADVNIDLFTNNNSLIKYKDMLATSNYYLVNKIYPTRITASSSTLIDHMITNFTDKLKINFSIEKKCLSDHEFTIASIEANVDKKVKMDNRYIYKTDYDQMRSILQTEIEGNNNIESVDILVEKIQLAKNLSTKKIKLRTRNNNWITPAAYDKMKLRKKAYDSYKKDPNNESKKSKYFQVKKMVEKFLQEEKSKFISRNIEKAGNNSKKVWKVIKNTLSNKGDDGECSEIPCLANAKGEKIENSCQIANTLNVFFNNIGETIVKEIKNKRGKNLPEYKIHNRHSLFLAPVTELEICEIIMSLNRNASPGIDKITVKDLQELVYIIMGPITKLINKCLTDGEFPDSLKKAYITPIHKQGSKEECGNYRPISILNSISKIYEKVINMKIRTFIERTIGFDENQYGFLEKSGTESAITATLDQIYEALDDGNFVGGVFIDLTKAFDVVNHSKLLERLDQLGIRGICNDLIRSYLTNRTQCVKVGDIYSDQLVIKTGVPQGSLLGPLLYLLYIMNIPKHKVVSHYNIYADDTNLIAKAKTLGELENILNKDLQVLSDWLDSIELCINVRKTNYIIFKTPKKKYTSVTLKIKDNIIENVQSVKYLGIIIDEYLKWDNHVKKLKKSIIPVTMAIKRSGGLPQQAAKLVFNGFILSKIRYNICSWSHCAKFHVEQMGIVMNKALKTLFKMHPRTCTKEVYKTTGNLDINQLIYFEKCKYIYNIINGNQKSNIILKNRSTIHNYNTRSRHHIEIPQARTSKKLNGLKCSASKLYNKLPEEIKNCDNIRIFRKKLKIYLENFRG